MPARESADHIYLLKNRVFYRQGLTNEKNDLG